MEGYEAVFALAGVTTVMAGALTLYIVGSAVHAWARGTGGRDGHDAPRAQPVRVTPWRPVYHRKAS